MAELSFSEEIVRETLTEKVALLLAAFLLFPLQPFFSERNTTNQPPSSPARSEWDHLSVPDGEGLTDRPTDGRTDRLSRLFLTPAFILHLMWMTPFFVLCGIATLDLSLKLACGLYLLVHIGRLVVIVLHNNDL